MVLSTYVSTGFCFHLASISFFIALAVFSFSMLLVFCYLTHEIYVESQLKITNQITHNFTGDILKSSWLFSSKIMQEGFPMIRLVLIGNFDNIFLHIGSLRHSWQSVEECLVFLSCSRLVQESVENIDKTDFLAAGSFFPKDLMFSIIFGNLLTNTL